jgi:hypothetical protein
VVPLAAPGGDGSGIAPFDDTFIAYATELLRVFLATTGTATLPVVAYGSPVRQWLTVASPNQVPDKPEALALQSIQILEQGPKTAVLPANHPSAFFYFEDNTPQQNFDMLFQDLVAARWQARMSAQPRDDPAQVLADAKSYWQARPDDITRIVTEQEEEFGFAHCKLDLRLEAPLPTRLRPAG